MADPVTSLPIDQLEPNPFQPRGKIKREDIAELIRSVEAHGVLEPLVVAHTPAGYQIIAGERRWRAAREAGLPDIPVYVRETTPKGMLEMALVENVQRADLTPIERGQAFHQLIHEFNYSNEQIAERVGKSVPYVTNSMRLLRLPDAVKDGLIGGLIAEGHARALLGAHTEKGMISCYKTVLKKHLSIRQTEEYVRQYVHARENPAQKPGDDKKQVLYINQKQVDEWQKLLKMNVAPKAKLGVSRSDRQTKVTLTLQGSPEKTQQDFENIMATLVG